MVFCCYTCMQLTPMRVTCACRSKIQLFGMLVQKRAAQQQASPSKYAQQFDVQRVAAGKRVPEYVKTLLKESSQEKGTSNAAKGRRKPKPGAATELAVADV